MPVLEATPDPAALTLTVVCHLAAPPETAWRIWSDPALLGRWWGPPGYPATFTTHDLKVGGLATYYMQGPNGERFPGGWRFTAINAPHSLAIEDHFADAEGNPKNDLPQTHFKVTLAATKGATTMTITSHFATLEQMEQLVTMGMVEGIRAAAGQIDALL